MEALDSFGIGGGIRFFESRALRVEKLPAVGRKGLRLCFILR